MKILFDYPGFELKVSGAGRYFLEIIRALDNRNEIIIASKYMNNISASEYFKINRRFMNDFQFIGKSRVEKLLQRKHANQIIKRNEYDIFHATGQDYYYKKEIRSLPLVITVHDLIYEMIFQHGTIDSERLELYNRADRIIAISNNTKLDLINLYPNIDKNKIFVIHHGVSTLKYEIVSHIRGNYILYVGTRKEEYKNFKRFVNALHPLLIQDSTLKIVCTGLPFTNLEIQMLKKNNLIDKLVNVGFVSDMELYSLYANAMAFVFPSIYEGFGLPILEAFNAGCPVCLSNTSCFPEIAGNAALYFDPFDENSIYNTVSKLIYDIELKKRLINDGIERLKLFSWINTANKTEEVYKSILL